MPRIPYKTDPEIEAGSPPGLIAAIRARRGGRLAALDRILLHSAPFATGWGELMGRVRNALGLDPRLREAAMCGVAAVNGAAYEIHHHASLFLAAGGTQAQLDALHDLPAACARDDLFDAPLLATLRLTLEMTRDVQVRDATFAAARAALGSDERLFELIAVIASYNMVSRILVAVGISPDD